MANALDTVFDIRNLHWSARLEMSQMRGETILLKENLGGAEALYAGADCECSAAGRSIGGEWEADGSGVPIRFRADVQDILVEFQIADLATRYFHVAGH